ncbi:MAG: hypothetical protein ACFFB5_02815 [Promethearchaeota archaeon]
MITDKEFLILKQLGVISTIFYDKKARFRNSPYEVDPENIEASCSAGILIIFFLGIVDPSIPIEVRDMDE